MNDLNWTGVHLNGQRRTPRRVVALSWASVWTFLGFLTGVGVALVYLH